MVKLFSFDESRLEVAKYLYDRCIDREECYPVADLMSFASTKEQLLKYINAKQGGRR